MVVLFKLAILLLTLHKKASILLYIFFSGVIDIKTIDFDRAVKLSYASDDNIALSRDNWANIEPAHMHKFYELSYTYRGEGVHIINGVAYHIKAGTLILFSKMDNHSFYSIDNFAMINCCFKNIEVFKNFPLEETLIVSLSQEQIQEIDSIFKIIEIELNLKEKGYRQIVASNLDAVFTIMRRHRTNRITTDPVWGELLNFVIENFQTVTLQDALDIMGMSKSYFCRKFKNRFSISFLTYVNRLKIQHSQRLLTSTDFTIEKIAELSGYGANICRFHEDFKKYIGITPHKYKIKMTEQITSASEQI